MKKAVIGFEGIPPLNAPALVEDGYFGLDWFNFDAADEGRYQAKTPKSGFADAIGSASAANRFEDDAGFGTYGDDTFNLRRADIAAGWNEGLQVTVTGFRDGVQVAELTFTLDTVRERIRFGDAFTGLDYVQFHSEGGVDVVDGGTGTHISIDDITLTSADSIW